MNITYPYHWPAIWKFRRLNSLDFYKSATYEIWMNNRLYATLENKGDKGPNARWHWFYANGAESIDYYGTLNHAMADISREFCMVLQERRELKQKQQQEVFKSDRSGYEFFISG